MLIFMDTEFTDFINTEVLSIGLVTSDAKHEFYAERTDYEIKMCSEFVRFEIIPLFDKSGFVGTKEKIGLKLAEWLRNLPYTDLIIVIDYHADWQILADLLIGRVPMKLNRNPIYLQNITDFASRECIVGCEEYFEEIDKRRHHSLVDAKSNRNGWLRAMKTLY